MIEQIKAEVKKLMCGNNNGHGFDHIERVYRLAVKFAELENADVEIVTLAALLHDVDDYKLVGAECAENLSNTCRILKDSRVDEVTAAKVCEIIQTMGYSKALKGVRPQTLEGKIVSDADMLDAIGAMGLIRNLSYALERSHGSESSIFDKEIFPELNLSSEEYKKPNRKSDNCINHFFEKLLKLKSMIFTKSAQAEAQIRHDFMVKFLQQFFIEDNCPEWLAYLENYEQGFKKVA